VHLVNKRIGLIVFGPIVLAQLSIDLMMIKSGNMPMEWQMMMVKLDIVATILV
jgi:hypothetical protein